MSYIIAFELVVGNSCYYDKNALWAVNILTNGPIISDPAKRGVFQHNWSHNDKTIGSKSCCANLSSILEPLTRWLPKAVLKKDFFDI